MKKIFTLFAALAMVMSMSAVPYLKGSFNGWGEGNSLSSGSTTVTLNANATYEFKVNDGSNWYGNNGTMTSTNCTDWTMSSSGGNCKITTTIAGVYTFKWNASSKKLSVVYPTEAVEINYYITGSGNLVGGDGWKANEIKMTNNDGTYTYTFTNLAAGNYEMKITQGNWDNTLGFSNLATSYVGVTGNNDNNIIMALADATNLTVTVTGTTVSLSLPEKTNTIYFVNEKGWAKVNAYVWTDNPYKPWPGEAMTKVEGKTYGGKDVYTYTYPANNSKVIFNDGASNQTGDLTYSEATPYYYNEKWNASIAYDKAKYNVNVTAENGTVTGAGEYEEGKEATLTATPAEGYEFVNWTKGEEVVSTENPYKFTVTADVALVANFIKKTISYEMNGGAFPEVKVPTNEELALVFKQEYAEYFAIEGLTDTDMKREVGNFIYVTNSKGGDAIKFITENANWKWLHDYILTVAGNIPEGTNVGYYWRANLDGFFHCKNAVAVGGVASADYTEAGKPENWGPAYQAAHAVVLPTEPVDAPYTLPTPVKEGYKFVGWYDNAEGTGEPMTVIPAGWDGTLYAIWVEIYTITVEAENGTVEGAGNYEHGAEATLTATAAEGYEFTCWTSGEDTVSTANPYKFTVTADVALVANFKEAEPEYDVMDITMTNLVVQEMEDFVVLTASDDSNTGLNVMLAVNEDGSLAADSYMAMVQGWNEVELPIVEGTITKTYSEELATDVYSGLVVVEYNEGYLGLDLTMYYVAPEYTDIVITNATVTEDIRDLGWGDETYTVLLLESTWSDGVETYPVLVEVNDYDLSVVEGTAVVSVTIGGQGDEDPWLGNVPDGEMKYTIADGVITLQGKLENASAWPAPVYWNLTISGKLPQGPTTALDNIAIEAKAIKMIKNGQLIIIKNGVQYNVQGQVIK